MDEIQDLDFETLIKIHIQMLLFGRVSEKNPEYSKALAIGLIEFAIN